MEAHGRVVLVDDDVLILKALGRVLATAGYDVGTFSSATAFLAAPPPAPPCCVLLDVDMPEVSGLDVQQQLLRSSKAVPVIFITGLRDVPTTIAALKNGAIDFLLKPIDQDVLLRAVAGGVARSVVLQQEHTAMAHARARFASLTPREREVCLLVAEGLTSREIAGRLGTAEGTISLHRAHVMAKLGAGSVAEVVRMVFLTSRGEGPDP